jgi:hypothetical protein
VEVVDNLGEDAAPVDGVDGAEVEGCVGVFVGKQSLENVLNFVREDMLLGKKRGGGGLTWQSSKVPPTDRLWTLSSRTVVI